MNYIINRVIQLSVLKVNFDKSILIFRIYVTIAFMRAHGLPKLFQIEETLNHIPDPLGLGSNISGYYAIFVNIVGALMVGVGLFTRLGALLILSVTLSGLLLIHSNDSVKIQDGPLIYSIVYGYIFYVGAGKYSLDKLLLLYSNSDRK